MYFDFETSDWVRHLASERPQHSINRLDWDALESSLQSRLSSLFVCKHRSLEPSMTSVSTSQMAVIVREISLLHTILDAMEAYDLAAQCMNQDYQKYPLDSRIPYAESVERSIRQSSDSID